MQDPQDPQDPPASGATVKVDHQTGQEPPEPKSEVDLSTIIPEDYKGKPYMEQIKTVDDLFKTFDNAQSLIGQRQTDIPKADASEEEWTSYFEKIRPEKADAYEFPETEYATKFGRNEEFTGKMQGLFHKAGLTPVQAKILIEGYDSELLETAKQQAESKEQTTVQTQEIAKKVFKEGQEQAVKNANVLIEKFSPPEFDEQIKNLGDNERLVLAGVLNNVYKKFMSEDEVNLKDPSTGMDRVGLQEEARQLMASEAYKDFRHPQHDSTVKKVAEMYDQLGKMK